MRRLLLSCIILITISATGQTNNDTIPGNTPTIYGKTLKPFLDSLKAAILADTIKYKQQDVVFKKEEVKNKNPYSKLFVVQHLKDRDTLNFYSYKLDVVEPKQVVEFVNEYLNNEVVKMVTVINDANTSLYSNVPGVLWIDIWDKAKFNPKVAGLVLNEKGDGSNFSKEQETTTQED